MTNVTATIEHSPVFVAARNSFEAEALAAAKFARIDTGHRADWTRSSLNHHTTAKPLWKVTRGANGYEVTRVNL